MMQHFRCLLSSLKLSYHYFQIQKLILKLKRWLKQIHCSNCLVISDLHNFRLLLKVDCLHLYYQVKLCLLHSNYLLISDLRSSHYLLSVGLQHFRFQLSVVMLRWYLRLIMSSRSCYLLMRGLSLHQIMRRCCSYLLNFDLQHFHYLQTSDLHSLRYLLSVGLCSFDLQLSLVMHAFH